MTAASPEASIVFRARASRRRRGPGNARRDAAVILQHLGDPMALADVDAELGRVVQQQLVEHGALHLVRSGSPGNLVEADAPRIGGSPQMKQPPDFTGKPAEASLSSRPISASTSIVAAIIDSPMW